MATISKAAQVTVLEPIMDATYTTGSGPVSIGATVIVAQKGPVGLKQITMDNLLSTYGKLLATSDGELRDGLFHVWDALDQGNGCEYVNVVRITPSDAAFPVTKMDDAGAITTEALSYGTSITLGAGEVFAVYPTDGDPSTARDMDIEAVYATPAEWADATDYTAGDKVFVEKTLPDGTTEWSKWYLECTETHLSATAIDMTKFKWVYGTPPANTFDIVFYDDDESGTEYELERHTVSLDPDATDESGLSMYLPDVLNRASTHFAVVHNDTETDFSTLSTHLTAWTKTTFTGGTNGTLSTLTSSDWQGGWDAFKNPQIPCDLMFMAGNRDADVINYAMGIAESRRSYLSFDVSPRVNAASALDEILTMGLKSRQAAAYYCPLKANDPFSESKYVWGASGAAVAACARGNARYTGIIPGVHFPPAGHRRGMLRRTGIEPLFPTDAINKVDFVNARLNPVEAGTFSGAVISDALSHFQEENYGRFIWVNRIANYIDQRFIEGARQLKFEPGGLAMTGLGRMMERVLDDCVTAGMLTTPREPERDGTDPYQYEVKEVEIDLYMVTYSYCPAGAARRIVGQPVWIR